MVDEITNANDVELILTPIDGGETVITNMARIAVDDYNINKEEDSEAASGIGNSAPVGISVGDESYEFSFTANGENAELLDAAMEGGEFRYVEFIAKKPDSTTKVRGRVTTYDESGSSGEMLEIEFGGIGAAFSAN